MLSGRFFLGFVIGSALVSQASLHAESRRKLTLLEPTTTVELELGTPLFKLMDRKGGIADVMDQEAKRKVTIQGPEHYERMLDAFSPDVVSKLMKNFKGRNDSEREKKFYELVESLEGTKQNIGSIIQPLRAEYGGLGAVKLAPLLMLSSGGGVAIPMSEDVRTYHYGYKPGDDSGDEDPTFNRTRTKSGRSFVDLPFRRAHDPSDVYFLKETMAMIDKMKNPWPAYNVMFNVLTKGDPAGIEKLPREAQVALGDWFGIYVAEQRRHRMTGWQRMDWENALTELFMLAPYTDVAGQIRTKDGSVREGALVDYFGIGNDGSGLGGKAGIERRKYTRAISNEVADLNPKAYRNLANVIGVESGDLCKGVMTFINGKKNQAKVAKNSNQIRKAGVDFIKAMRDNAEEIAERLGN